MRLLNDAELYRLHEGYYSVDHSPGGEGLLKYVAKAQARLTAQEIFEKLEECVISGNMSLTIRDKTTTSKETSRIILDKDYQALKSEYIKESK